MKTTIEDATTALILAMENHVDSYIAAKRNNDDGARDEEIAKHREAFTKLRRALDELIGTDRSRLYYEAARAIAEGTAERKRRARR